MDILNSLSRWLVGKRGEMHQLFEQCSQGYPRKEASGSVVGAAKKLTHSQTEGGVLNILRRLPMGMAMGIGMDTVTSDKYPYQCQMDSMSFPVVGPKGVPGRDMGPVPPYSQCLGGNPGSVTVSPAKKNINREQHLKQSSFPHTDPGKHHDVFQCTDSKNPQSQANRAKGGHFQELSKSSMWKHIFAPPFTPASAKDKYHYAYGMPDPAPRADLSHLYPYAPRAEPATETMHMGAAYGYPSGGGYLPVAPYFTSHMGTLGSECQAFSPTPNYSSAPHYVPCYISVIGQPSPMQVHQSQHIFISHPVSTVHYQQARRATQGTTGSHRPCHTTSSQQSAPSPTQYTQTVREKTQPPVKPSKQDDPSAISEVVNGIKSLHVSPKIDNPVANINPTSAPVGSPPQSVQSSETTSQSASMELNCDNQQESDTIELNSSESAISDNKDNDKCAQADSSINEHEAQMESGQESHTPKSQPSKLSSTKDSHMFRQPCAGTPNTNPRKKRKCRPSAEKRRRRRMSAICTVSTKPTTSRPNSDSASSSKKLKTDHASASEEAARRNTMSATVAFILGLDSEDEVEEIETKANLRSNSVKPSHVKTFSFSISSCSDSDSDFDDASGGSDTTDGVMDDLTWGGLNISLDPFNFQCLGSTPITIKKTMSSPQLTSCSGDSEADVKHPLSCSPTRRTSLGKHVKFASEDLLVTVHTIEDELEAYQEARKGDWEQFARDRCRFRDRTNDIEKAISWVFDPHHRARVYRRLHSYSQSSSSQ